MSECTIHCWSSTNPDKQCPACLKNSFIREEPIKCIQAPRTKYGEGACGHYAGDTRCQCYEMKARIKLLDNLLRQGLQSGCFAGELKDKVNASIATRSGE